MILRKSHQSSYQEGRTLHHQELEIVSKEVYSREEAADLDYDDFKVLMYHNGKLIGDISNLLSEVYLYRELIDQTEWEKEYCDNKAELKDHP